MTSNQNRTGRALWAGFAAVAVLALGACGSPASADKKVASLGTDAPSSSDATANSSDGSTDATTDDSTADSAKVNPETAFADYAECMRDEGIDMPDPQVVKAGESTSGEMVQTIDAGSLPEGATGVLIDPNSDDFKDAEKACKHFLDDAIGQIKVDPAVQAEQRKQMLAFAKCMRDHGLDFPDPTFQDGGATINIQVGGGEDDAGSGPKPDSEEFQAANKDCGKLIDGGGFVTSIGTPES